MKLMGIVGWKNSGKTTLVTKLIEIYNARGIRVSTIKHAHHAYVMDQKKSDTAQHVASGAHEVMIAAQGRWALQHEGGDTPDLTTLLTKLSPVDLVLIEGFKSEPHPKIFCHRAANGAFDMRGTQVQAIASDTAFSHDLPVFDLSATDQIAEWIGKKVRL